MQEINAEYASLFQRLKNGFEHSEHYEKATERQKQNYSWDRPKKCWIIHFDDYYRHGQQSMSMSYIREKYGSVFVKSAEKTMIE